MISKSISNQIKKPRQKYLLRNNKKWFNHYCEYILDGKILHVGNGLGYASELIKEKNSNIISLDISIQNDTINKNDVVVYDGEVIPYKDESFDAVLCDYVLHHTPDPSVLLKELIRVTKKNGTLIILEQAYSNIFQRIKLIYSCWKQNKNSDQKVSIYWKSYFSRKSIRSLFYNFNLDTIDVISEQRKSSYTEMFFLKK